MLPELADLQRLVRDAARAELLPRFAAVTRHVKTDGSLVTEADHAMQQRMQRELAARWPAYAFLGEEMAGDEQERLTRETVRGLWCLDPLDGTSNFAAGIPFFAVSLALLLDGRPALGLVYDPVRDECFMARQGEGAQPPYGSQRNFGSSSLEWCWLADGRFHLYLHGGQKLWDYAAGWLILSEVGGYSATLDGEEVFALGLAPRSVVAARDSRLFSSWQAWLRAQRRVPHA